MKAELKTASKIFCYKSIVNPLYSIERYDPGLYDKSA